MPAFLDRNGGRSKSGTIRGTNFPDEATDSHVAVIDGRPAGIRFWNGNRVVDGEEALSYQLPHEQPIQSFSLEVDGDKRTAGKAWFDEVAVEPLPRE